MKEWFFTPMSLATEATSRTTPPTELPAYLFPVAASLEKRHDIDAVG